MFLIVGIGSKIVATVMLLLYFSITDLMLLRRTLRLELPSEDEEEDHPKKIPKKNEEEEYSSTPREQCWPSEGE